VQHEVRHSKEIPLGRGYLHTRAHPCNARPITRNEQVSGSSPLVGSLLFLGFAGKMPSDAKAPVLRQGRFTAPRLLQSTNHSACRLIFASRRSLAPLRGMARSRPAGRRGTGAATPERLLWTSSGSLCARKLAVRGVTTTLAGLAGHDPHTKATVRHQLPPPAHRLRNRSWIDIKASRVSRR
jgi:hypothetical protein